MAAPTRAPVEIVLVYQSLLGIYGDRGNATVLDQAAAVAGYDTVLTVVEPGDPIPDTGQVYLLGGMREDAAQISRRERAARRRRPASSC